MGKTTLVKLMTGQLNATEGNLIRDRRVRILLLKAYYGFFLAIACPVQYDFNS